MTLGRSSKSFLYFLFVYMVQCTSLRVKVLHPARPVLLMVPLLLWLWLLLPLFPYMCLSTAFATWVWVCRTPCSLPLSLCHGPQPSSQRRFAPRFAVRTISLTRAVAAVVGAAVAGAATAAAASAAKWFADGTRVGMLL